MSENGDLNVDITNENSVLCKQTLKQLEKDVGVDLLPSLLQLFIEDSQQKLAQCLDGTPHNYRWWQILLHSLKGCSGTYGALKLTQTSITLERLCLAKPDMNITVSDDDLSKLNSIRSDLETAIKDYSDYLVELNQ